MVAGLGNSGARSNLTLSEVIPFQTSCSPSQIAILLFRKVFYQELAGEPKQLDRVSSAI